MDQVDKSPQAGASAPLFYGIDERVVEVTFQEPPPSGHIPESIVQSVWEEMRFRRDGIQATSGEPIVIRSAGLHNRDAGPDFLRAQLSIGGIEWTGDVEIHVSSGQWYEHGHHLDTRYNSVILHVTLQRDMWTGGLKRADGSLIPELVLEPLLEEKVRSLVHRFYGTQKRVIPCAAMWPSVDESIKASTIEAQGIARLTTRINPPRKKLSDDTIEQLLYERVLESLGYAKNAAPMLDLAKRLPLADVSKLEDEDDLEALFLGTAGLLPSPADLLDADRVTADRAMDLKHRFERLRYRSGIQPMSRESWVFFRLRPTNFPTLRIAQAAALVREGNLFSYAPLAHLRAACLRRNALQALRECLSVELPPFWAAHVRLDRRCRASSTRIGRQRCDTILVNAVLPILHHMARRDSDIPLAEAVVESMRRLPAERNEVTRLFGDLGTAPGNALESQGIYELYSNHCLAARCLRCDIGRAVLSNR
jgi:hypothetical protein